MGWTLATLGRARDVGEEISTEEEEDAWANAEALKVFFWRHLGPHRFTWKQLNDAGETLASKFVQNEDGTFGWILIDRIRPMERRINNDLKEARDLLISALHELGPSKMASEKDIEIFYLLLWQARQEFNFHSHCVITNNRPDIIQDGNSVDDVIKSFAWMEINCIPKYVLRGTVESLVSSTIRWKEMDSVYEFALSSFPNLVKTENSFLDNLKNLQKEDFWRSPMLDYKLRYLLDVYLRCTKGHVWNRSDSFSHFIERQRRNLKKLYLEGRETFQRMIFSPVQFLVYLEHKLNYVIRDPVVEIAKLWTCFGPFDLDYQDLSVVRKMMGEHSISEAAWDDVEDVADEFGTKISYKTHNIPGDHFTWKQLHDAGETIASIFGPKGGSLGWKLVRKKTKRIDKVLIEARGLLISALQKLPSKMVSKKDLEDFHLLVREARQEFKFHDNYVIANLQCDFIEPGSSVDDVLKNIPWEHIHCIPERALRRRLESLISLVTTWKKKDLFYEFALSSPDLVKKEESVSDNLKMLQQDFVRTNLISEYELQDLLKDYMDFIKSLPCDNSESYRHHIEQERQEFKKLYLKARESFVPIANNPVQFPVYLEHKLNYVIQDPVVEIAKLMTYFGPFDLEMNVLTRRQATQSITSPRQ